MSVDEHGGGGRIGETVAEALQRLATGHGAPVWVVPPDARTVEQALSSMQAPSPAEVRPQSLLTMPDDEPEVLLVERLVRLWKPLALIAASVSLVVTMSVLRIVKARAAAPRPAVAAAPLTDAEYLAEVAREIDGRCVAWKSELADVDELLSAAEVDPAHVQLHADDVFAGSPQRPRALLEGALKNATAPSPLHLASAGGLNVRKFHDATVRGTATRVIVATW